MEISAPADKPGGVRSRSLAFARWRQDLSNGHHTDNGPEGAIFLLDSSKLSYQYGRSGHSLRGRWVVSRKLRATTSIHVYHLGEYRAVVLKSSPQRFVTSSREFTANVRLSRTRRFSFQPGRLE